MELTDQDRRLLALLQADAGRAVAELAEAAGMSASSCWRRLRALEDAGVIRGRVALCDAGALGLGFAAIVHVSLTRHEAGEVAEFVRRMAARAEVLACWATSGEADYHLHVVAEDIAAYNAFLDGVLFPLPAVAQVRTNLILRTVKAETALPV
ncbi:MAG: Lrp/AsnC family transcriptional regulator [Pseudomonadota bacterium]